MIEDGIRLLVGVVTMIGGIAATMFLLMSLYAWQLGPRECAAFGEGMRLETRYLFWSGCFVTMPDGRTLPKDVAEKVLQQEYRIEVQAK